MKTVFIALCTVLLGACASVNMQNGEPRVAETFTVTVYNAQAGRAEDVPVRVHKPSAQLRSKPAVLYFSHCSGTSSDADRHIMNTLLARGVLVAQVDSLRTAGRLDNYCGKGTALSPVLQAEEAFRARDELVKRGLANAANVGIFGSSRGGWVVTYVMYSDSTGNVDRSVPFRAAIATYPYCQLDSRDKQVKSPTLMLVGERDDWTPSHRCERLKRDSTGEVPFELKIFPNATHAWTVVGPNRTYLGYRLEFDAEATTETIKLSLEHFEKYLELN